VLDQFLSPLLEKRRKENSLRKLFLTEPSVDFTSNDYLGLASNESLFNLIQEKMLSLPHKNGATGSRLLSGNSEYSEKVESNLADVFKAESSLIFNSGYAANQAVLSSIPQKNDTILYDELVHACMRDGARLSHANRIKFSHNDLTDLEEKLSRASGTIFIAVESIYSMDGDQCPLVELVALAENYNAIIILDEAHSTGVMGKNGSGLAVQLGVAHKIPIRIYTFGKAMGVHGACVAGSHTLKEYLINFGRTFIFSTAMPPHSFASIECSFQFLAQNLHLQQVLAQRIDYFTTCAKNINSLMVSGKTHIQSIIIPGNDVVKKISQNLQDKGFDIRPILSPTVAKGSERLRICLHTFNTEEEIANLLNELSILLQS
jgi:8-amino-7-oxononanoate synthase